MSITEIISAISTINSITGISIITILTILVQFLSKHLTIRRFLFSKRTIHNCVWEYIEPQYEINGEIQQGHIAKKLKQMIYKLNGCKMVIIMGNSGMGKTSLVNRFIWKYDRYFWLKNKSIVRISGLACQSVLEIIDNVENKENTILIIDGLEEAYLYNSGDISELAELNRKLFPFYGVLVTVNENFYRQTRSIGQPC